MAAGGVLHRAADGVEARTAERRRTRRVHAGVPSGAGAPPLFALKLPAQRLDSPAVEAPVPEGKPRGRADVDDPLLGAKSTLQVIDETDPVPASRMKVVARRGDDDGAWHCLDDALHSGEGRFGIADDGDRLDAMKRQCIPPAARTGREKRAGRDDLRHDFLTDCVAASAWDSGFDWRACVLPADRARARRARMPADPQTVWSDAAAVRNGDKSAQK